MKKVTYIVRLGFTQAAPATLVEMGRNCVTMLTGNATYPTPVPALAAVTAACDTLDMANQAYAFNGGKLELEARDVAYEALKAMLRELAGYVQSLCDGDKDKILSAGFDVRRASNPIGPLPAPGNVRATPTAFPASIKVRWDGVHGRHAYELYINEGDPLNDKSWRLLTLTSKNHWTADGLTSNTTYYFRVVAQGAAGPSPVSDVASAKAA